MTIILIPYKRQNPQPAGMQDQRDDAVIFLAGFVVT